MATKPRLVIGNVVIAKAIHVTSESECSRRYGQEKKKKWLKGTVIETNLQIEAQEQSKQITTWVEAPTKQKHCF